MRRGASALTKHDQPHLPSALCDADHRVALPPNDGLDVCEQALWAMQVKLHLWNQAHIDAA